MQRLTNAIEEAEEVEQAAENELENMMAHLDSEGGHPVTPLLSRKQHHEHLLSEKHHQCLMPVSTIPTKQDIQQHDRHSTCHAHEQQSDHIAHQATCSPLRAVCFSTAWLQRTAKCCGSSCRKRRRTAYSWVPTTPWR